MRAPDVDSSTRPLTHPPSATWFRMRGFCTRLRAADAIPCTPLPLAAFSPAPWCHTIPLAPPKMAGGRGAALRKLHPGQSADGQPRHLLRRLSSLTSRRGLGGACCRRRRRLVPEMSLSTGVRGGFVVGLLRNVGGRMQSVALYEYLDEESLLSDYSPEE